MSNNAYELLALTMRYVFTALILLIVFRAARGALVDARRAATLRRLSPMTGLSGELVLLDPLARAPRGMHYPVIREGMIGASRRADIRIRDKSIRGRHALFQLTESGLRIRAHAGARFRDSLGNPARELTLLDGDSFYLGGAHLLLVLSAPDLPLRPVRTEIPRDEDEYDDLFDSPSDPVSPIFERDADPYDDTPLYAKPRGERLRRPNPPARRAPDSDPVSPIFDADHTMPARPPRKRSDRVFLEDEADLFHEKNDDF